MPYLFLVVGLLVIGFGYLFWKEVDAREPSGDPNIVGGKKYALGYMLIGAIIALLAVWRILIRLEELYNYYFSN
jgi:hypothetical protein